MSLRTHLDRYCMQPAMTTDLTFSPSRSRLPTRPPSSSSIGPSPFHRPTGWQPPTALPHRPVILKFDLKSMQQLASRDPYYNILAPQVAGNLSTDEYDSLFQTYKVIYPDYAGRHSVDEIKTMVVDIMAQCCSVFLNATDFYLMVDTDRVPKYIQILDHPTKALDIGNPQLVLSGLENPSTPRCLHQTLHYGLATHSTSRHFGHGLGGSYSYSKHSQRASVLFAYPLTAP